MMLQNYLWPGNVRALETAIEHAFVLSAGAFLEKDLFPPEIRHAKKDGSPPPPTNFDLNAEEENIKRALLSAKGNRTEASKILGIHRSSLWRKMREFRIDKSFGKDI